MDGGYVGWAPQPGPQQWLLECPVPDALFGGARGGGKTDALLGDWAAHASRSEGYARGILIRRTTPQLEEIVLRSKEIYAPLGARWFAGSKTWEMPCGSLLKMRWLDRDEDADQYQGHSYDWIGFDELGSFPDPSPIDKMRATLRNAHGVPCVMRATANPGGAGHAWIKERYIDPAPPLTPFYDAARATWRVFIPSRVKDNRKLLDADPSYLDRLRASGPAWLVRAWLEGDWNASANVAFFDEAALLVDGAPVDQATPVDVVYAIIDTAMKDGKDHDGTAIVYFARNKIAGAPLLILDWDILSIKSDLLADWLPAVHRRLEGLAREYRARSGWVGPWIEDKGSGTTLLQHSERHGMRAQPLPGALTALGKDGRCLTASPYVYGGKVKIARFAYEKVSIFHEHSKNHLLSQVCSFVLGTKNPHQMDLLDCFTYGIAIGLGNSDGY